MESQLSSSEIFSHDLCYWKILQRIQKDLQVQNIEPEIFGDRVIFMSMFNSIEWTKKGHSEQCISNSERVQELREEDSRKGTGHSLDLVVN